MQATVRPLRATVTRARATDSDETASRPLKTEQLFDINVLR